MSDLYFLMNKDIPIALLNCDKDTFFVNEVYGMMPYNTMDMTKWIKSRRAADHRLYIKGCETLSGFVDVTHCVSLSDTFWIRNFDEKLNWRHVSLFENDFDNDVAECSFNATLDDVELELCTPELSTGGDTPKRWFRTSENPEDIYLLKRGTVEGLEAYSEALCSQLAACLSSNYVHYDLTLHNGELVTMCKIFTTPDVSFVKISDYYPEVPDPALYVLYLVNDGFADEITRLLLFDMLTLNIGRHVTDYGILVNSITLRPISMAPNFDYNASFLPHCQMTNGIKDFVNVPCPTIGSDLERAVKELITSELITKLEELRFFKFSDPGFGFPEERLQLVNYVLQKQIENILRDVK